MLFNSFTFLIFFAAVMVVSRSMKSWTLRKSFLLLISYLFYAAWNPPFVILLWISTLADWHLARAIHTSDSLRRRRLYLWASLGINLGMLGYFKYANFFVNNLVALSQSLGLDWHPATMSIVLPVGISFYTFQTLSYTIDIYRRKATPWHCFLDYALYVTFFPQLVAGPIVRAVDFLPQCDEPKRASRKQFQWGLTLMIIGLFCKTAIADTLAPIVESVYDFQTAHSFVDAWAGTLAFSVQIFCDFAGYSTIAIGAALCLGFILPDNFHFPYAAIGFSDFWRRWHLSLSTWLRDYLYIPLGGSRCSKLKTYRNLALTMLLGGLWHGASWTFIVWGGLHGSYLVLEQLLRKWFAPQRLWASYPMQILLCALTFIAVCFAWVFFRARSFHAAGTMIASMTGQSSCASTLPTHHLLQVLLFTGVTLGVHWYSRNKTMEETFARLPGWLRGLILGAMVFAIFAEMTAQGAGNAFLYFQF